MITDYPMVTCPECGPVEHYRSDTDEAHCPCVTWDGNSWEADEWCRCACHNVTVTK